MHQRKPSNLLTLPTAASIASLSPVKEAEKPVVPPSALFMPSSSLQKLLSSHKSRSRTSVIAIRALAALALLSIYIVFFHASDFQVSYPTSTSSSSKSGGGKLRQALETIRHHSHQYYPSSQHGHLHESPNEPLVLSPEQELAAISAFIISLPENVLPHGVNPSRPVEPEVVLDFNVHSGDRQHVLEEVDEMVEDVWRRNPVVLYCRLYSPASRELKSILADLHLLPSPTIIDVDVRDDAEVLEPVLERLSSSLSSESDDALPMLLVGGQRIPTGAVRDMSKTEELKALVEVAGAKVDGRRTHRKGRKH